MTVTLQVHTVHTRVQTPRLRQGQSALRSPLRCAAQPCLCGVAMDGAALWALPGHGSKSVASGACKTLPHNSNRREQQRLPRQRGLVVSRRPRRSPSVACCATAPFAGVLLLCREARRPERSAPEKASDQSERRDSGVGSRGWVAAEGAAETEATPIEAEAKKTVEAGQEAEARMAATRTRGSCLRLCPIGSSDRGAAATGSFQSTHSRSL